MDALDPTCHFDTLGRGSSCPRLALASTSVTREDVDGRDEPGHDDDATN
jgi:hypothetical protein